MGGRSMKERERTRARSIKERDQRASVLYFFSSLSHLDQLYDGVQMALLAGVVQEGEPSRVGPPEHRRVALYQGVEGTGLRIVLSRRLEEA